MENTTSKKSPIPAANAENKSDYGDMSKNEITVERTTIKGTPFIQIYSKAHGYSGGIAEHRMTPWYETEEELLTKLQGTTIGQLDWDLLTGFVSILIDKTAEMKKIAKDIEDKQNK